MDKGRHSFISCTSADLHILILSNHQIVKTPNHQIIKWPDRLPSPMDTPPSMGSTMATVAVVAGPTSSKQAMVKNIYYSFKINERKQNIYIYKQQASKQWWKNPFENCLFIIYHLGYLGVRCPKGEPIYGPHLSPT